MGHFPTGLDGCDGGSRARERAGGEGFSDHFLVLKYKDLCIRSRN